jgi:L-amino acid N-acyltransferase YncA
MPDRSSSPPVIRPANPGDAAGCLDIYAPLVRDTAVSFETEAPTVEEFARRIAEITRDYPWLVCDAGGMIAGFAYGRPHRDRPAYRWSVEVSVYVARQHHRKGIGRALYAQLLQTLRRQGYANAYAGIALPNAASVSLHESFGFTPVGVYRQVGFKLGRWRDVGWWALRLRPGDRPPKTPIPYATLDDD